MPLAAVAGTLDRLVPVLAGVRRVVGTLALLGAFATALIGWALFAGGLPGDRGELVGRILVVALAFVPAGVLWMLWAVLGEVIEIPQRLRRLPETAVEHAGALQNALRDLDGRGGRGSRRVLALWRLATLPAAARDSLLIYAPLAALLSVPFLLAALLSALVVPIELLVGLVALAITS